jgi:hypothetical protein
LAPLAGLIAQLHIAYISCLRQVTKGRFAHDTTTKGQKAEAEAKEKLGESWTKQTSSIEKLGGQDSAGNPTFVKDEKVFRMGREGEHLIRNSFLLVLTIHCAYSYQFRISYVKPKLGS